MTERACNSGPGLGVTRPVGSREPSARMAGTAVATASCERGTATAFGDRTRDLAHRPAGLLAP